MESEEEEYDGMPVNFYARFSELCTKINQVFQHPQVNYLKIDIVLKIGAHVVFHASNCSSNF